MTHGDAPLHAGYTDAYGNLQIDPISGDDGRWALDQMHEAVRSARVAVRERITVVRRWAAMRPDPSLIAANQRRVERERAAHGEELAVSVARSAMSAGWSNTCERARARSFDGGLKLTPSRCMRSTCPLSPPRPV
jgi:hypothetical protein